MSDASRQLLARELARIAALVSGEAPPPRPVPRDDEDYALDRLCALFALSAFERDVLLMCAGMELDAACAAAVERAQNGGPPTFSLALASLPEAHWSALLPTAPLRYWRLITLAETPSLVGGALRIDERVLHYLLGLDYLDPRLGGWVSVAPPVDSLVPGHARLADRLRAIWRHAEVAGQVPPAIQLCGPDTGAAAEIAGFAAAAESRPLLVLDGRGLSDETVPSETLLRLLDRETLLAGAALLVMGEAGPGGARALDALVERAGGPLVLAGASRRGAQGLPGARVLIALDVERPSIDEQTEAWRLALAEAGIANPPALAPLAYQFDLSLSAIRSAALAATGETDAAAATENLPQALWRSSRAVARAGVADLMERITPRADWSQLVLPPREQAALERIVAAVRDRPLLHGAWGFPGAAHGDRRGFGIAAMFAGPSGTGKTLAAEVLAHALDLDLYRIDLSQVVNKYIGETEKNLARVFDAAEAGGAVLLFDEADALFGKRSEVKDSHDRHANIEVSYLLARVERYSGVAILTTNLKDSIDQAFLRRMRFVVNFPFPDTAVRARIWDAVFPPEMPREQIDPHLLAQLNVTGGIIRNIARNAAAHAVERHRRTTARTGETGRGPVLTLADVRAAAVEDYDKIGRTLTGTETAGWH